jgi:glycosyltransferase involved in cell wall biosynthesis
LQTTIIIPIYNETESLQILQEIIDKAASQHTKFLFVDNGSTDPKVATILRKNSKYWESITVKNNLGFGGGILHGSQAVKTQFVGWMPGNLKVNPNDVLEMLEHVKLNPRTVIKAKRTGRTTSDKIKTFLAGITQSLLLRKNMLDTGGTPTICHISFLSELNSPPKDYVFESYVLYMARKLKFHVERPHVFYGTRKHGKSHWQKGIRSELTLMLRIVHAARKWN